MFNGYAALAAFAVLASFTVGSQNSATVIDGITFADSDRLYVPVREAAAALNWPIRWENGAVYINEEKLDSKSIRALLSGMRLIYVRDLERLGATVQWSPESSSAKVSAGDSEFAARAGEKRAIVDKAAQELRAYQGDRLVLRTRISTGARGKRTPTGTYTAGPLKSRMHFSSLYNNAPMPYSVQLAGHIFIHGFRSVPSVPASHGCIRVPLTGGNPARWFYRWVDIGTPVTVKNEWQG